MSKFEKIIQKNVTISVILTTYNSSKYLKKSVESILNQTYKKFELIIVDDCSTDDTKKKLKKFSSLDERIKLIFNKKNLGAAATFNIGAKAAIGHFIVKMDSDDISISNRIELQLLEFLKRPKLQVLGGNIKIIDRNKVIDREIKFPIGKKNIDKTIRHSVPVADPTIMIRKSVLEKVNYLRENMEAAEDYDLWLRINDMGYEIDNLNTTLLHYRHHENQLSIIKNSEQSIRSLIALKLSEYRRINSISKDILKKTDRVNEDYILKLPINTRPSELEIFEFKNILISNFDKNLILTKINELQSIIKKTYSKVIVSRIYIRSSYAMYKNGSYVLCIYFFLKALFIRPRSIAFIIFNQFKGRIFG